MWIYNLFILHALYVIEIELFTNKIIDNKLETSIKNDYYYSLCIGNEDISVLINIELRYSIVNIRGFDLLCCVIFNYNNIIPNDNDNELKKIFIDKIIDESKLLS